MYGVVKVYRLLDFVVEPVIGLQYCSTGIDTLHHRHILIQDNNVKMVGALGRLDAVGMMVFLEDVEVVLDLVESFLAVI